MARALAEVGRQTVKQLARAKWQSSGLSDAAARRLRFAALSSEQVAALHSCFHRAGALRIPYFDLDGEPSKFYRLRYLEPLPGAAGLAPKPQKYDQLPVAQEAYFPPVQGETWRGVASDPGTAVCITEGELKAACATYAGIPTIGLGGVYSFMSQKRGLDLLPSLREFEWEGRVVTVVYDNDLTLNPQVLRAQNMLAAALCAQGAKVFFGGIPPGPAKGIDDYIVAHGVDAFKENVLERAVPYAEGEALYRLNEEVVYIKQIDNVVERATGLRIKPFAFTSSVYANRHCMVQTIKGKGKNAHAVLEKLPLAPRWLSWEQRAELERLTYEPGAPTIIDGKALNTWAGWGVAPKRGDVEPWKWLMAFLFGNDRKTQRWFEQWCAWPLQHPGAKMYTACVIWSRVKRLGKSMAFLALSKIYGENAVFVDNKRLKSTFNTWAKNKQLVIGEETTGGENERFHMDADYLKFLITSPVLTIEEKNLNSYEQPNHANFAFLSNQPDAAFVEDGDKRYLIHEVRRREPAEREKYEWCNEWLHGEGPAYLFDHLLRLNLRGFNPREHAPETASKWQMIVLGKNDIGLWVMKLREDPRGALSGLGARLSEGCDLFSAEQLCRAFDPEGRWAGRNIATALGKALVNQGFRHVNDGMPMGCGDGKIHRLWAIRNQVRWDQASRAEAREHYDQYHGPDKQGEIK